MLLEGYVNVFHQEIHCPIKLYYESLTRTAGAYDTVSKNTAERPAWGGAR